MVIFSFLSATLFSLFPNHSLSSLSLSLSLSLSHGQYLSPVPPSIHSPPPQPPSTLLHLVSWLYLLQTKQILQTLLQRPLLLLPPEHHLIQYWSTGRRLLLRATRRPGELPVDARLPRGGRGDAPPTHRPRWRGRTEARVRVLLGGAVHRGRRPAGDRPAVAAAQRRPLRVRRAAAGVGEVGP